MIRRLESVAVLAGRAEVQVVGLAFRKVMVEHGARERRKQRRYRRERKERAECSDESSVYHLAAIIA